MPQTNAVLGSYSTTLSGMTSTITHNFAKDATVLTAVKKLSSGQAVKASYGIKDKTALVELAQAPFTVSPFALPSSFVCMRSCILPRSAQSPEHCMGLKAKAHA